MNLERQLQYENEKRVMKWCNLLSINSLPKQGPAPPKQHVRLQQQCKQLHLLRGWWAPSPLRVMALRLPPKGEDYGALQNLNRGVCVTRVLSQRQC